MSIVFDAGGTPGFGVWVTAGGAVSFVLDYRTGADPRSRKQKRMTIGRWPSWSLEAGRREARDLRVQIDKGQDPLQERAAAAVSGALVSDLAKDYQNCLLH